MLKVEAAADIGDDVGSEAETEYVERLASRGEQATLCGGAIVKSCAHESCFLFSRRCEQQLGSESRRN